MTLETILHDHLVRYPSMQIQDVYKLIHQVAMGSEHAVSNAESTRKWMERELANMGEGPDEPMIDPISADGRIARVHLRPFMAQGCDPEVLLSAFIRTANEFHGNIQVLENCWKAAASLEQYPADMVDDFFISMQAQNFPAVHHSPEYERLYRPAYRVVWRKFIA